MIIGIAIGTFIGGISLSFGAFFLYKWNQNKKGNKKATSTPENEGFNDTNHEVLEIPALRNVTDYRQEIISTTPTINNVHYEHYEQKMLPMLPIAKDDNLGGETVPSVDQRSSLQNIDVENFKNEILQVIKQEVIQDLKQELAQSKE